MLRRAKQRRSMEREAKTMEHVRAAGYPVPQVFDLSDDGTDLVMELAEGPSMLADLSSRPWRLGRHAATLAGLHDRLHAVGAPQWLGPAPGGEGESLVHLDLHPLNVMLGTDGPVVIDWANAARGRAGADVAVSWLLMATATIPGSRLQASLIGRFRSSLVRSFLGHFDLAIVRDELGDVVEWKCRDENMSPSEQARMRALARAEARSPAR